MECGASVNCINWAPWEYGLCLAAGVADGKVHILERNNQDQWSQRSQEAHDAGINGLSWGPATEPCLFMAENNDYMTQQNEKSYSLVSKRFVTAGMDGKVKIWKENQSTAQFEPTCLGNNQTAHEDWARDVAWCNNVGMMQDLIASVGEDQKLYIWKSEHAQKGDG